MSCSLRWNSTVCRDRRTNSRTWGLLPGSLQPRQRGSQRIEELAATDVDDERHPADAPLRLPDDLRKLRDQSGGEVVDAEEPHVLQCVDREGLARAAQPRDDEELHLVGDRGGGHARDGLAPRHQMTTRVSTAFTTLSTMAPRKVGQNPSNRNRVTPDTI